VIFQRLNLLKTYLRQPRVPAYAIAEAQGIAAALEASADHGKAMGDALLAKLKAGDRKGAIEVIAEIEWVLSGGDKTPTKKSKPQPKPAPKPVPVPKVVKELAKLKPSEKVIAKPIGPPKPAPKPLAKPKLKARSKAKRK